MRDDWMADPKTRAWGQRVAAELFPKVGSSAVTISLVPSGASDVKFCVELGATIMFDKPIILVIRPGQQLPAKLVAVADEIVEMGEDPDDETTRTALREAINRVTRRAGPTG